MVEVLEFDPDTPSHCSVFIKRMREIFETVAPEQYEENKEVWRKLEKSVFEANSHSLRMFQSDAELQLKRVSDVYDEKVEKLTEENSLTFGKLVRAENQVGWWEAENKGLKDKIGAIEKEIEQVLKDGANLDGQRELREKIAEIRRKNEEIEELKTTIQRQELKVKFIELEKEGAIKYAELQVLELQQELRKLRIDDFEREQDETTSSMDTSVTE